MKTTIRIAALLAATSMVAGCTNGLRIRDRQSGSIKLPAAPKLDANPDEAGTVGSPSPSRNGIPTVPSTSPFEPGS
jgi:hypothetical protein